MCRVEFCIFLVFRGYERIELKLSKFSDWSIFFGVSRYCTYKKGAAAYGLRIYVKSPYHCNMQVTLNYNNSSAEFNSTLNIVIQNSIFVYF